MFTIVASSCNSSKTVPAPAATGWPCMTNEACTTICIHWCQSIERSTIQCLKVEGLMPIKFCYDRRDYGLLNLRLMLSSDAPAYPTCEPQH